MQVMYQYMRINYAQYILLKISLQEEKILFWIVDP